MTYKATSPTEAISLPRDSVVEWFLEDPNRYERLASAVVEYETREVAHTTSPRGDTKKEMIRNTIIGVVLSVPRSHTDAVTTELRKSRKVAPACKYLQASAQHADDADAMLRRIMKLEAQLKKLAKAYVDQAARAGGAAQEARAKDFVSSALPALAESELAALWSAIKERQVEVAAKMLERFADDDIELGR